MASAIQYYENALVECRAEYRIPSGTPFSICFCMKIDAGIYGSKLTFQHPCRRRANISCDSALHRFPIPTHSLCFEMSNAFPGIAALFLLFYDFCNEKPLSPIALKRTGELTSALFTINNMLHIPFLQIDIHTYNIKQMQRPTFFTAPVTFLVR